METNFNDILWTQTQIVHNGEFHKKCIIGVPIYKEHLSLYEIASLAQLCKIIQNSYEICLIYPFELNISEYQYISKQFGVKLSTLECSKEYFKSTRTYSYLCETTQFYECFSEYKYLFIYQLDGWIFKNLLDYYIDLDVDYIGSPWKEGSYRFFFDAVGNGGVSLRRVQKFIEVCRRLKPSDFKRQYVEFEDLFFCKTLRAEMGFKFPTVKNAANFSLTLNWNYFIEKYTKGHLPMCLHAWDKEYNRFKRYINIEQYKGILDNIKNEKEINKDEKESEEKMNYDEFVRQYYNRTPSDKNNKSIENKIENRHINILIVHYNTPYLTECLIKSINKFVGDNCTIYIFDNSDKEPFKYNQKNLILLDNTDGEIINFNEWLKKYPNKTIDAARNGYGSAKHCYTVEKCFDIINDNFILMDSDILLKQNIVNICDDNSIFSGEIVKQNNKIIDKVAPFLCYINVHKCKENNIHYFNEDYMFGLHKVDINPKCDYYDTGASFYLFAKKFQYKTIKLDDYIVHLGSASWTNNNYDNWLKKYKKLYTSDKIVVSFTTYKMRVKYASMVIESLLNQTFKPYKICLTLFKDDLQYVTKDLQKYFDNGEVELIITNEDLGPHKKYYYAMKKYKDHPIVTVDDDVCYNNDLLESLNNSYLKFPYCINARRVHKMKYDCNGVPIQYNKWLYEYKQEPNIPSFDIFATGVGGVLYPPDILDIDNINLNDIKKCLYADDVFLKFRENQLDVKVVWVKNDKLIDGKEIKNDDVINSGLALTNNLKNRNDEYIKNIGLCKKISNMKKCIYTCITNNYENLMPPTYINSDFDYICFTDNLNQNGGIWNLRSIPDELKKLSKIKQQRIIKICPHRYLPEYEESIWVDGNIDILENMNTFINEYYKNGKSVYIRKHPSRNCIYVEARKCIELKKDTKENIDIQLQKYRKEHYPSDNGLVETNIIYRKHNDEYCKKLMECWAKELVQFSHRDQLSFNYALWKIGKSGFQYLPQELLYSKYFYWYSKHNRKKED